MPPAAPLRRGGVYAGPSPESEIIIEAGRFRCKVVAPQKVFKAGERQVRKMAGSRNEPNGRKTDGRTDEMIGRQIGRKFGSDGKNRLVQMVRLL